MWRITKWALELMGLNITYTPQMTIKSQALEDFVVEWTETHPPRITQEHWSMYFDGSFTLNGAREVWCSSPPWKIGSSM
jgi:hypothetical protein